MGAFLRAGLRGALSCHLQRKALTCGSGNSSRALFSGKHSGNYVDPSDMSTPMWEKYKTSRIFENRKFPPPDKPPRYQRRSGKKKINSKKRDGVRLQTKSRTNSESALDALVPLLDQIIEHEEAMSKKRRKRW